MFKRIIISLVVLVVIFVAVFYNIHSFLSPNKPVKDARILVIDAWLSDRELDNAVEVFKAGNYVRVIVPGGLMERSLFFPGFRGSGDIASVILMYKGIPPDKITPLLVKHVQKDRTYQAALTTQKWLNENKISPSAINVFTSCTHSRRSWMLYKKAFANDREIGIISARPLGYKAEQWWKSSNGFRTVVDEAIAYLYALIFFHPDL
jgi:uncharacterized SAM-binding protein YcdF (DUF218 family)